MGKSSHREISERREQIMACLRSEDTWTSRRLCQRLGMSYRTLMRDLAELKESGVPILTDRGRGGGIALAGRWGLSQLQLSNTEVIALLTSLAITESLQSPILVDNLKSIRNKISSAFPKEQQKIIAKIRKRIFVGGQASKKVLKSYSKPLPSVLSDLTDSFFNQTKVEIDYSSATNEKTTRLIEPQVLCLVFPVWYFLCWDELRQSERLFRIDRILSTKKTNKVFKRRRKGKLIEGAKELFASI